MCPLVSSFVHWKMEICDTLVSFQNIFTKIGRHLPLDPSHELIAIQFYILVWVLSASCFVHWNLKKWDILVKKVGKNSIFKIVGHLPWDLSHIFVKTIKIFFCVSQLDHLFTERWKCMIYLSVFKISPKLVDNILLTNLLSPNEVIFLPNCHYFKVN